MNGGINTYGYAYQDPIIYIDPDGQFSAVFIAGGFMAFLMMVMWAESLNRAGSRPITLDGTQPCETCAKKYSTYIPCFKLDYMYSSEGAALSELKNYVYPGQGLRKGTTAAATRGPCSADSGYEVGAHTNILFAKGGSSAASIVSCPCCRDTAVGPRTETLYGIK